MSAFLVVALAGLATFAMRYGTVAYFARRELPEAVATALRYVAPAMMTALVASTLTAEFAGMDAAEIVPRAVALGAGVLVAVRTRKPASAMAVGFPVLWLSTLALVPVS